MDTFDIYFKDSEETINKGFNIKDKDKAIRMAQDMLRDRKGFVKQFNGGEIMVKCKETDTVVWKDNINIL